MTAARQTDPNPSNNSGAASASRVVTTVLGASQFTVSNNKAAFNPQTGLYEQTVTVQNSGANTVAGFWLYVTIATRNVSLANASGNNGGVPYVQYALPLDPANSVSLILKFSDPNRVAITDTFRVVAVIPSSASYVGTNGAVAVNAVFTDTRNGATRFVIEFASVPGKRYAVIYSSDLVNWQMATPSISATANITQWYDDGPPETDSKPGAVRGRFYRVLKY